MPKVTYFLGAGASSPTMPLVKAIPEQNIRGINDELLTIFRNLQDLKGTGNLNVPIFSDKLQFSTVAGKFESLIQNSERHASVDTYAKKLYMKGDIKGLQDLKYTLSFLFTVIQCTHFPNPKYDSFLASTLKIGEGGRPKWRDEIKILTWNYDMQTEIAAMDYFGCSSLNELSNYLLFYPRQDYLSKTDIPSVLHLNGVAGLFEKSLDDTAFRHLYSDLNTSSYHCIDECVRQTVEYHSAPPAIRFDNLFSFSWERNFYKDRILEYAKRIASETKILVVIGYSFPFFNRDYDRLLFEEFAKNTGVIYIQNPNFDSNSLKEKFPAIKNVRTIQIQNLDQFHLPEEL